MKSDGHFVGTKTVATDDSWKRAQIVAFEHVRKAGVALTMSPEAVGSMGAIRYLVATRFVVL